MIRYESEYSCATCDRGGETVLFKISSVQEPRREVGSMLHYKDVKGLLPAWKGMRQAKVRGIFGSIAIQEVASSDAAKKFRLDVKQNDGSMMSTIIPKYTLRGMIEMLEEDEYGKVVRV